METIVHGAKGTIMLGKQEMKKKGLKDRDLEKNRPHRCFFIWLQLSFVVAKLYVELKWKAA